MTNSESREHRLPSGASPVMPYRSTRSGEEFGLINVGSGELALHVRGNRDGFSGASGSDGLVCPLTAENGLALMERFDWLRPRRLPKDRPSFGFGDRVGLATPGHIRAVQRSAKLFPVLAQQSVRENVRTHRSFASVLADAVFGAFREGYESGFGADADHLKQAEDALEAARLGYSFFTCDPGDHVIPAEVMSTDEIRSRFNAMEDSESLTERYANRAFAIADDQPLYVSLEDLERTLVKYGGAIEHAARMYQTLVANLGQDFDYEVSVDETQAPTTPIEHLIVALELRRNGVDFVSLAPRFVGAMEKGVDWRGDIGQFATDLLLHAQIAEFLGGYRLSLHSGSDKFSIYELFAHSTGGRCHVKTAGTSYLVGLEVVARYDASLFRSIVEHSLSAFVEDKATYHISVDLSRIPPVDELCDDELAHLILQHDSRQVLHVAFGSVLTSEYAEEFRRILAQNEEDHFVALARHLGRHVEKLEVTEHE